jgi:hypothetical protein
MAVVKRAVLLALFTIAMFDPTDTRIPFMLGEVVSGRAFTDFYVTATGNSAGDCSVGDPCTLTRAVARCTAGAITGGDTVHIAAGRYTTASRLTISCSGSVGGNYVKWIADDNAQFVPGVIDADTLTWSQTAGRTYTYQATWDEVAAGISLNAMVQEPGHDGPQIVLDDGNVGLDNKDFTLTGPPRYRSLASVESVELQSCSFYNDTVNNLIYIHMCDGTAPDSAANLWLQTSSSGAIEVTGDYLWFENWHTYSLGGSQVGFSVTTASNGGYMTGMDLFDTQLRLQGTNWTVTQSDFHERIAQGVHTDTGCTEIASSLTRSGTTATFDSTTTILTNQMKTGMVATKTSRLWIPTRSRGRLTAGSRPPPARRARSISRATTTRRLAGMSAGITRAAGKRSKSAWKGRRRASATPSATTTCCAHGTASVRVVAGWAHRTSFRTRSSGAFPITVCPSPAAT